MDMVIIRRNMLTLPLQNISDPFALFMRIADKPYPFILENTLNTKPVPAGFKQGDAKSRFSIAGCCPKIVIKAWQDSIEISGNGGKKQFKGDPFAVLDSILSEHKPVPKGFNRGKDCEGSPCGGAVGYFGYDLKNILEELPPKKPDELSMPDMAFGIYDTLFVYDHNKNIGYIVSNCPEKLEGLKNTVQSSKHALEGFNRGFKAQGSKGDERSKVKGGLSPFNFETIKGFGSDGLLSNFTKDKYINAIKKAKSYISNGDTYQINLSQRFTIPFADDPKTLYSKLRKSHPVEYSAFLDYGDFQIISNSPECFLMIQDGFIETYPIKGTRPRGANPRDDERIARELRANPKELAEHIMIVDLERNDLGKVSAPSTVKVKELEKVVTYPTLHHMVSCVAGKIRDGITQVDCIKPCFPGGSVTGAPKIRAMEIIDELEPTPRGLYTGAIGYIDFSGSVNLGMAIRTAVVKDKKLYLNVGGGIVADSIPEDEYKETLLKAEAFLKIIYG